MKATFAIALIALFITSSSAFESCVAFSGLNAFNLCPYAKKDVTFTVAANTLKTEKITFSIANNNVPGCNGGNFYAIDKSTVDNKCQNIANKTSSYSLINKENSKEGLLITYPGVDVSENEAINNTKQVIVVLKCNMNKTMAVETQFSDAVVSFNQVSATESLTTYTITGESRYACPGSADFLWDFVKENKTVFATVLIVLGSLFNFFGFKLVKFTIFAITAVIGFAASGMFLYSTVDVTTKKFIFWVLAFVCLSLGLALGYLAHKLRKVAIFVVGAALGLVGGYLLYSGVLNSLLGNPANGNIYCYVVQTLCAVIGGILAFFLDEIIFILSTSVVGSYLVAVSVALFTGQFHNEDVTGNDFGFGQYKYYYLAGIVILAGCGIYYQHASMSKKEEEIDEENSAPKYGYAYYRY